MLTSLINSNDNIFISIACYRDSELIPTIKSAYETADNPDNLFFGIYLQYNPDEDEKYFDFSCLPKELKIKVKRTLWYRARGPIYARYVINNYLYKNQKYYLQIDSHTRFIKGWDTFLIEEINKLPNYSILTTYPPGYTRKDGIIERDMCNIMKFKKLSRGIPIFRTEQEYLETPVRNYFWAAGYSFCEGIVFKKVPFDKYLKNLFMGEEYLMSLRFYANGIKLYSPHKNVIYTLWDRDYRPTFWEIKNHNKLKFYFEQLLSYSRLLKISNLFTPDKFVDKYSYDLEKYKIKRETINNFLIKTNIKSLIDNFDYKKQYKKYYFSLNSDKI